MNVVYWCLGSHIENKISIYFFYGGIQSQQTAARM